MKTLTVALLIALSTPLQAATLEVAVSGLASTEGRVLVGVYDSAETWMKKPLRAVAGVPGADGKLVLRIENLPDGDYAFNVLHDSNGNNKMDFNAMGMPTEAYAFSNKASGTFGPPKFDAARFSVKGDTQQRIDLN
jgi:uncharacterized protein (DUF2141 family)